MIKARRQRAIVFAALPATMSGGMAALTHHFQHSRSLPYIVCGMAIIMVVPLAFALREVAALRKEGCS